MGDRARSGTSLLIHGATGDLALRMLLPSLYFLERDGLLPADLRIRALARSDLAGDAYLETVRARFATHHGSESMDEDVWSRLARRLSYHPADATDAAALARLKEEAGLAEDDVVIHYLAVAPQLYAPIVEALGAAGLAGPRARLALEKPIGEDLASARRLNAVLDRVFGEERVFRVDHYLGKETVQNLLVLRFANSLFEPLWSRAHIEQVQITIAEQLGVGERAPYYDRTGALKDMVQNHLLQLLCLVAMEPPSRLDPDAVRAEKVKVLEALRPLESDRVLKETVRGQYTAGVVAGERVPGYLEEAPGRSPDTETFVAIRAEVLNWRWRGVPFYLRTGKRLAYRYTEIFIAFRPLPHSIFPPRTSASIRPNALVIRLQPEERVTLQVMSKVPGLAHEGINLREVSLDLSLTETFRNYRRRIAYERLLLDLLAGDATLFVRRDEVEAAWRWIDGIYAGWRTVGMAPRPYPAGSWGPAAAIALTERHGHSWHE